MTPQEQGRRERSGESRPWGYDSWSSYRTAQMQGGHQGEGVDLFGGLPIGTLFVLCFPILILAAAAFLLGGWLMDHHVGYRDLLETFFPSDAIATRPSQEGAPAMVAAVVAAIITVVWLGLRVVRWAWLRAMVRSDGSHSLLMVVGVAFVIAVAATSAMVALGPFALVAGAIAAGDDLRSADPGDGAPALTPFGLLVSSLGICFWAGRSTRRSLGRALRRADVAG